MATSEIENTIGAGMNMSLFQRGASSIVSWWLLCKLDIHENPTQCLPLHRLSTIDACGYAIDDVQCCPAIGSKAFVVFSDFDRSFEARRPQRQAFPIRNISAYCR